MGIRENKMEKREEEIRDRVCLFGFVFIAVTH